MKRSLLTVALLVAVLVGWAAVALAQPAPITLRLKFTPNEVVRYRVYGQVDGAMNMGMPNAPAGAPTSMPVQATVSAVATTKTLGVDSTGAARLSVRLDKAEMAMNMMGKQIKMVLEAGKMTMYMDGQPTQTMPFPGVQGMEGKLPLLQEPVSFKIDPRGKLLDFAIPGMPKLMPGMPDMTAMLQQNQILLPEQPLNVGDTWTEHQEIPYGNVPLVVNANYTLAGVETRNGKTIARIRVTMTASVQNADLGAMMKQYGQTMPPNMPAMQGSVSLAQNLEGTMLFNVTTGRFIRFDFQLTQQMANSSTVTPPNQAQPMTVTTDMNFNMKGAVAAL